MILLGLCGAASSAVPDDFRYEIVDGAIVVFGHTLIPGDPLPKAGECDDCGPFHWVNLVRSPAERWVLIISDVHLANFDAWIFDTKSKAAPSRFMIKSVQIDDTSLVVTYDTTARGKVRDVFFPQVLAK